MELNKILPGFTSLVLLLALPGRDAALTFQTCEEGAKFEPVPGHCGFFIACVGPKGYKMPCPSDLVFSLSEERCVYTSEESLEECQQFDHLSDMAMGDKPGSPTGQLGDRPDKQDGEKRMQAKKDGDSKPADKSMKKDGTEKDNMGDSGRNGARNRDRPGGAREGGGNRDEERSDFFNRNFLETVLFREREDGLDFPRRRSGLAREQQCQDKQGMVAHENLCHHYFDCSSPYDDQPLPFVEPYEKECPYPQQFSTETNQCEDYSTVDCGDRQEMVDPCDYHANMCSGPNCRSCRAKFASCQEQPDGIMYWPGREGTGFWVECQDQRTRGQGDCGTDLKGRMKIFDPDMGRCVMYHELVERMCRWTGNNYDLPHYDECHKYYDCTNSSAKVGENEADYVRTCKYPQLFSVRTGKCEDYGEVECGTRKEPLTPCEYMKCGDPDLASCVGFPDGDNVCRTKEGSPHYVTCRDQRTVEKHMCPLDSRGLFMQFAPGVRQCLPVDASA